MSMTMKEEFSAHDMATAAADGFRDGQRAAQSVPAGEREEVEVVAWQDAENPLYTTAERRVMQEWANNQYPIVELMTVAQHQRILAAQQRTQSAAVPDGYALVPFHPTPEMVRAAEEAHMPFGDMDIALRMAILAAAPAQPAAHDQGEVQRLREALECVKQAGFDCGNDGWGVIHMTNDDWQIVLAALAASTGQEQASRCSDCGYLTSQREHLGCLRKAVAELDAATGGQPQASAAQSAPAGWRAHSVRFARGVKCPQSIETLQAAWDRDQELIEEQRAEISRLSQKLNQARQGMRAGFDLDAWLEFATDKQALIDEIDVLREQIAAAPAQPAAHDQGEVQRLLDWIACAERLPADKRDVMVYCADSDEHMVGSSIGGGLFLFATASHGEKVVCRPTHWRYIDESDKPDLAASAGQEQPQ